MTIATDSGTPGTRWHRVVIETTSPNGDFAKRTVEGDDAWVAASLRAMADQICPVPPPVPVLRSGPNPVRGTAGSMVRPPTGTVVNLPPSPPGRPPSDPMSMH